MRKVMFGFALAVCAAATVAIATPASAGITKACWAHYDDELAVYEAVWANGGGHFNHVSDSLLGYTETRSECDALFNAPV